MARYVDGFVIPMPKKNLAAYRRMSQKAGRVWRDHGALEYRECAGDDISATGIGMPFTKLARTRPDALRTQADGERGLQGVRVGVAVVPSAGR